MRNYRHQKTSNFIRSLSQQVSDQDKNQGLSDPKACWLSHSSFQGSGQSEQCSKLAFGASAKRSTSSIQPSFLRSSLHKPYTSELISSRRPHQLHSFSIPGLMLLFLIRNAFSFPPNTSCFALKPSFHHHHETFSYLFHLENVH